MWSDVNNFMDVAGRCVEAEVEMERGEQGGGLMRSRQEGTEGFRGALPLAASLWVREFGRELSGRQPGFCGFVGR